MKNFIDFLNKEAVCFEFAQTNRVSDVRHKRKHALKSALLFFPNFFMKLRQTDTVMFNFSDHGVVSLFPFLSKVAHKLGKKVILRKFGGSFDIYLGRLDDKKRAKVLRAISQSDLILLETKAGISHLQSILPESVRIEWFPNVRNTSSRLKKPSDFNRRLVFLSHVSDEKGVADLLKVKENLPADYELHVYGAIKEDKYTHFPWENHNVVYHGEISSDRVSEVLANSMLLLFPSYYREGYPGIIIEAFSTGLPVVTSNAGGIGEMYTDGKEGFMVECGDIKTMTEKILTLTPEIYERMCRAAHSNFIQNFEAVSTNRRILNLIKNL